MLRSPSLKRSRQSSAAEMPTICIFTCSRRRTAGNNSNGLKCRPAVTNTINVEIEPLVFYFYCFIGTSIFENLDDERKNNNLTKLVALLVRVYIVIDTVLAPQER